MHPVTALMLSRSIQADQAREIERNRHRRALEPGPNEGEDRRIRFGPFRLPRPGIAGSRG